MSALPGVQVYTYESLECTMTQQPDGRCVISTRRERGAPFGTVVTDFGRITEAWAIMLELDESQRVARGLPPCEAVTRGTALCMARADKVADGTIPLPRAPTCWSELVAAELWPLSWLGAHAGEKIKIVLPNEQ